jgi:hypothetical protein
MMALEASWARHNKNEESQNAIQNNGIVACYPFYDLIADDLIC